MQNTSIPVAGSELRRSDSFLYSVQAEQSVLGGILQDISAMDMIANQIGEHDFYGCEHRLIFKHIAQLAEQSKPIDVITVAVSLERSAELDQAGGSVYLDFLAQIQPSAANILHYVEIVRERAMMRKLYEASSDIANSLNNPGEREAWQLLDEAKNCVLEITEAWESGKQSFVHIPPFLTKVIERIETLYGRDNASDVTGIATGFTDLDSMTSGLQPGDLIIVAGRPSMGKTAFSLNIAEHVALELNKPVAIFTMEMGGIKLAMRMIGSVGRVNQHTLRTGNIEDNDWQRITKALGLLNDAPIFIDETAALNSLELCSRARRLHWQSGGLGLIVIDYIQLMSATPSKGGENRATEISEITCSLRALAKELQVPVIALSQLKRSLEKRPNKRPVMYDLREFGTSERYADLILFIYRDEYYYPESRHKGKAEIIIGKQRNGPIGTVELAFSGEYMRFDNVGHSKQKSSPQ